MTSATALAAPVVVGTRLIAAARAPQILVDVILKILVHGVGVNRRHQPARDAKAVVEHLGDWRETVGGA
jgi:hypothetical protein